MLSAMKLRFYDSLKRDIVEFDPIDPSKRMVRFYSCGPTVYDFAHVGNFRSFLNADVLRRTLELLDYKVVHVMNMTDVGHMTDDELADGGGEDKMEAASRRVAEAKKSGTLPAGIDVDPSDPVAIADFYAEAFRNDAKSLGMLVVSDAEHNPKLLPRPTQYIAEMIGAIEDLLASDHAYVGSDGAVYFDIQSFPDYGALSGNTPDKIRSGEGGRVQEATQALKRHPADFLLWKPDKTHLMRWPSPWGEGYPGWHIECSVMAHALLGQETDGMIDIHSGGEDNIFPHHECEIAQSRGVSGAAHFSRYWLHTRFLRVEGSKMSKSLGNFFTLRDLRAKGISDAAVRLELIRCHYRTHANFTFQGLTDCQRQIERWARLDEWLEKYSDVACEPNGPLQLALRTFTQCLCDDLNVSGAIAALNGAYKEYDLKSAPTPIDEGRGTLSDERKALRKMNSVLGVLDLDRSIHVDSTEVDEALVTAKIAERKEARRSKDWARADKIRDELHAMGIAIEDSGDETSWTLRVVKGA